MSAESTQHTPVMPDEVVRSLAPLPGQTLVDGTLGGGGHTRLLVQAVGGTGRVIAIDRDPEAIARGKEFLRNPTLHLEQANFGDLPELLARLGMEQVDGILLDLGLSSDQLADRERGFSFRSDGPLDLRFDFTRGEPAWKLLQRLSANHLADIIYRFGEERRSRRIARAIVDRRRRAPIQTSFELAAVIRRCVHRSHNSRIDPATKTFQALRIEVNDELKWLEIGLRRLPDVLRPGGRLTVISFHSLEDRLVKEAFRDDPRLKILTRRPIRPSEVEIDANPRARSAKLRVAERNAPTGGFRNEVELHASP